VVSLFPPTPNHVLIDWHVIFDGGSGSQFGNGHWLQYLRPGFRHCYTARYDGGGWTVLESGSGQLHVSTLPCVSGYSFPDWRASEGSTVVRVRRWVVPRDFQPRGVLSCVSLTKFLLGVRASHVVTPYQLYRQLVDSNGRRRRKEEEREQR
jgi:hypothetical protein